MNQEGKANRFQTALHVVILTTVGVILNVVPARLVLRFGLPLYLDALGTILATMIGGFLPGVFAGFISNFINGLSDPITLYYSAISILFATATVFLHRKQCFSRVTGLAAAIIVFAIIGGVLGSLLTWCLYGFSFGEGISAPYVHSFFDNGFAPFIAELLGDFLVDLVDKGIVVFVAAGIFALIPQKVLAIFAHLHLLERAGLNGLGKNGISTSLLTRVVSFLIVIELMLGAAISFICIILYRDKTIESYEELANGVATYVSLAVDGDRIDEFIELGDTSDAYQKTELQLYNILNSVEDISYVYVYKCLPDGIHVVFDLDAIDEQGNITLEGEPAGTIIPYDASFEDHFESLLLGEEIDPIITNDTYGWLLTVYVPIRDSSGITQAYACADIAVIDLISDLTAFLAKIIALLVSISILILYAAIFYAERFLIIPVNTMEREASSFAFGSEGEQEESLGTLEALDINTGDEIERLYAALTKLASDSTHYISEIRENAENLTHLQEAIIIDFASMVEARDKSTGDHIQKTAFYVDIIGQEMLRQGLYPDEIDQEFVESIVRAAPLHDVGKIKISDTLLNKPGRLTDEEFELMKTHTTEGMKILSQTLTSTADIGYLKESIDMAWCHHEWWNGTGYPRGLSGEEIPLSARIMAVADVFDALVSRRSYKKPFSFDAAVQIIREESGTHFDPKVAGAFLDIVESLRASIEEAERLDEEEHPEDYS